LNFAYLEALVAPLAGCVEVLVHLVKQPKKKLLGIVLRRAAELRSVPIYHCLKAGAVITLVLASPQRLQHVGQLLGELSLSAELSRVNLVASLEVSL